MKTINDVYEQCTKEDLVNSPYNWGTEEGEFEADLAREEAELSELDWEVSGWVKVKEGQQIPVVEGEMAGYLLKLENGEYYGMVTEEGPVVVTAEKLENLINRQTKRI